MYPPEYMTKKQKKRIVKGILRAFPNPDPWTSKAILTAVSGLHERETTVAGAVDYVVEVVALEQAFQSR